MIFCSHNQMAGARSARKTSQLTLTMIKECTWTMEITHFCIPRRGINLKLLRSSFIFLTLKKQGEGHQLLPDKAKTTNFIKGHTLRCPDKQEFLLWTIAQSHKTISKKMTRKFINFGKSSTNAKWSANQTLQTSYSTGLTSGIEELQSCQEKCDLWWTYSSKKQNAHGSMFGIPDGQNGCITEIFKDWSSRPLSSKEQSSEFQSQAITIGTKNELKSFTPDTKEWI